MCDFSRRRFVKSDVYCYAFLCLDALLSTDLCQKNEVLGGRLVWKHSISVYSKKVRNRKCYQIVLTAVRFPRLFKKTLVNNLWIKLCRLWQDKTLNLKIYLKGFVENNSRSGTKWIITKTRRTNKILRDSIK